MFLAQPVLVGKVVGSVMVGSVAEPDTAVDMVVDTAADTEMDTVAAETVVDIAAEIGVDSVVVGSRTEEAVRTSSLTPISRFWIDC